ncbi:right-handed parallel beta-helix repeat-containing protein [Candidatus Eisenbacteria bacterium]|uniref:Right-handed parallel beta-helix repeat-containing protein n=1 Tax=Eiseniibacteriota bacterium TaxID=2212470 RepID=A0ABV6YIB9_UNCEI
MRTLVLVLSILAVRASCAAVAEIYTVRPDGTGDYPTIQAAIDTAEGGDIIELTDGTYAGDGNRDISYHGRGITIRSQSGNAENCVIDCEGSEADPHRGFLFNTGETGGARLEGITVTAGWWAARGGAISFEGPVTAVIADCRLISNHARWGGGIDCDDGAAPTIENCTLTQNRASWSGGGLRVQSSAPVITGCTFHANHANHGGAMYFYAEETIPVVSDCFISDNIADHSTGGVHCELFVAPSFHRCTFTGNRSLVQGGALTASIVSTLNVYDCTFWANAGGSDNPTLASGEQCQTVLWNTIIASTDQGPAVSCYPGYSATLYCCDLYGNEGGDWIEEIADQLRVDGNIGEDPLFCDPEMGDFTLQDCSPCAPLSPPNEECDLIGAWAVGCGGTPVAGASWGGIKAKFRR